MSSFRLTWSVPDLTMKVTSFGGLTFDRPVASTSGPQPLSPLVVSFLLKLLVLATLCHLQG